MSEWKDIPSVAPLTPDEEEVESDVRRRIREAEARTIASLLKAERTPERVLAALENAVGFAETMREKYLDPATPPVACREGCSWCRFQTVQVTAPEVFKLVRFLQATLSPVDLDLALARLRKLDRETRGATVRTRYSLRLSCALLVDDRCSVYPARPFPCAASTSFDVDACKRAQRHGFDRVYVVQEKARKVAFFEVQGGIALGLSSLSPPVDSAPLELTAALLVALETHNVESRWLAGEPVFATAHFAFDPDEALP